jgi:hypothetical protein
VLCDSTSDLEKVGRVREGMIFGETGSDNNLQRKANNECFCEDWDSRIEERRRRLIDKKEGMDMGSEAAGSGRRNGANTAVKDCITVAKEIIDM